MADQSTNFLINFIAQGQQTVVAASTQVSQSLSKMQESIQSVIPVSNKLSESHNNLGTALAKAAERALYTIPIWMTLRAATKAVTDTFSDAVKEIIEVETALAKLSNTLGNMPGKAQTLAQVQAQAEALALQTGSPTSTNANVYTSLVKQGLDVQDAFAGMDLSIKGGIATFSDSQKMADLLATTYKYLGDSITEVSGNQDKLQYIMSTFVPLFNQLPGGVDAYASALKNFLPVASSFHLSMNDTLRLVAESVSMGQVTGSGTQLNTIFERINSNPNSVIGAIGSIQGMSVLQQYQMLLKLVNSEIKNGQSINPDVANIFGMRGLRVALADAKSLETQYERINKILAASPQERTQLSADNYNTALNTTAGQIDRINTALADVGKAIIEGVTGTNDFTDALKTLADGLGSVRDIAKDTGVAVKSLLETLGAVGALAVTGRVAAAGVAVVSEAAQYGSAGLLGYYLNNKLAMGASGIGMGLLTGGGILANNLLTNATIDTINQGDSYDAQAFQSFLKMNAAKRAKLGIGKASATPGTGSAAGDSLPDGIKVDEALLKLKTNMLSIGYNSLEIAKQEFALAEKMGAATEKIKDLKKDIVQLEAEEIEKSSAALQKSFQSGLSGVFNRTTSLPQFAQNFSKTIGGGINDALSGNFTEQIFKATGIGSLFGGVTTALRHASDGTPAGDIKAGMMQGADYAAKVMSDGIVDGATKVANAATTGTSLPGQLAAFGGGTAPYNAMSKLMTLSGAWSGGSNGDLGKLTMSATNMLNVPGWKFSPLGTYGTNLTSSSNNPSLTLPGFGDGGFMSKSVPGGGASYGQALGGTAMALGAGYNAYTQAGGKNGSLSIPSGILTTLGGLGLAAGAGMLGAGASGALAGLGAALGLSGPVGWAIGAGLLIGGLVMGGLSKTKTTTSQTQAQDIQIASKIDISNKQLQLVNRNLTAINSTLQTTYVLNNSAYFSTATNIGDQFSLDNLRA